NQKQIELFITKYFENINRGKKLLEVLKESNILDKLPTTPLTLTLISLLYEDTDYEIPATLTDIYNDFISILLGKLEVKSKIHLIDLELKKRIFAYMSYKMLEEKKFEIRKSEFIKEISSFLIPKGIIINHNEDMERIIKNSGLLYVDNNEMVGFKHLSFLEYFASYEIFYINQESDKLIENFNDVNWQNTAIFYAGISKDMPKFIKKLVQNIPDSTLRDWFINVGGMGYLAQALYMTDIEHRIGLIEKALDFMVLAFKELKQLSAKLGAYFNMPLHIIGAMLVFWFNMNFRSVTLVNCLEKLYDKFLDNNDDLDECNFDLGFKLFLLATTLSTEYLNRFDKLNDLIERGCFLNDPLLIVLGDMYLDIQEIDKTQINSDKRKLINKKINKYKELLVKLTKEPAYRFGDDYKKLPKK
ncbi:hypothetical protein JW964_13415, partial [candidate division KSB1 bacterium]|nr:hypothetical protein [candidate division KSB1 bacterium]